MKKRRTKKRETPLLATRESRQVFGAGLGEGQMQLVRAAASMFAAFALDEGTAAGVLAAPSRETLELVRWLARVIADPGATLMERSKASTAASDWLAKHDPLVAPVREATSDEMGRFARDKEATLFRLQREPYGVPCGKCGAIRNLHFRGDELLGCDACRP